MEENLKNKTKKGLYWSFFGQLANYGMSFGVGIVMARLLSPSDYGITALPAVFMSVAWLLQNAGLSDALVRKSDMTEEDLATSFYYSIFIGAFLYIVLFVLAPFIADFYNTPILTSLIRVTAFNFIWGPLNVPQNIILKRRLDFKTPMKISMLASCFSAFVGIGMAYAGFGLWALVMSSMLSGVFSLVLSWYVVRWLPKTGWSKQSFKYLWGYGNKMMISGILDSLYNNLAPIIIGKFYSPYQLGVYNRAQNYAALPSKNLTGIISNVSFPVLSKMQDDTQKMAYNYRRMLKLSAFIIFPVMLMLSALARPLVITMLTEKWESCIILLQIICFDLMWYPIHAINLNLLQVKGRSDLFLRLEVVKKIIGLAILFFSLPLGIVFFCFGNILSSMLALVVNTYYTGKLLNVGYFKQMKDLLPSICLSLLMYVTVHLVIYFIPNMLWQIFLGIIVGGVVYLLGGLIFKFDELNDIKYLLKK